MANAPTKAQRQRWELIRALGCIVCRAWAAEIHHCGTGAGGRKDHDKVIPLCVPHHRGVFGIHTIGRKRWRENYGSEEELMKQVEARLAA